MSALSQTKGNKGRESLFFRRSKESLSSLYLSRRSPSHARRKRVVFCKKKIFVFCKKKIFAARRGSALPLLPKSRLYPRDQCNPWLVFFRCQRGDDFFEARIASERIPEGVQF